MPEKSDKTRMKIIPPGKKKCVWMESGVVSYKLCDNNYDCPTCAYDQAMQRKVQRDRKRIEISPDAPVTKVFTESWVSEMLKLPASQRKCRYMITGEVQRKICPSAYECGTCSFDKMMQSRLQSEAIPSLIKPLRSGIIMAADAYYHKGHMWAKPEYGGRVRVGIDDFARRILGNLSEIMIPDMGAKIMAGESSIVVKKNGFEIRVLLPVDGIICKVNTLILNDPGLVNASPYEEGWIAIIESAGLKKSLKKLFYGDEAERFLIEDTDRLISEFQEDIRLAADGGEMVEDVLGLVDREKAKRIISMFLNPE